MMDNEIEQKALISIKQYESIINRISIEHTKKIIQINYYYDTDKLHFFNSGETLRIRQIENYLTLQMKYDKKIIDNVRISKELSEKIQNLPRKIVISNISANQIGFLLTERFVFPKDTYTVFLDKNSYLGIVDYEMEVEAENVSQMPEELYGVIFKTNSKGKYTRFIEKMTSQRDQYEISKRDI